MMMMPPPGMAAAHMMAGMAGMAGMPGHMGPHMMPGMFPHQGMSQMMPQSSQPLMPGPYGNPYMQAAQQHAAASMQQQRMGAGFAPGMAFMYNDMDRPVASVPQPLVHELAAGLAHMPPPMLGMSGQHSSNAMQVCMGGHAMQGWVVSNRMTVAGVRRGTSGEMTDLEAAINDEGQGRSSSGACAFLEAWKLMT
jgi:hypothetical protein